MSRVSQCTMQGCRTLAYLLLAFGTAWLATYRSIWYDSHVFARSDSAFEFYAGDVHVHGKSARIVWFFSLPLILAAMCGATFEAIWLLRRLRRNNSRARGRAAHRRFSVSSSGNRNGKTHVLVASQRSSPKRSWTIRRVLDFQIRPPGPSPWVTVGEAASLACYVSVMAMMMYQGIHYKLHGEHHSWTTKLKNIAKYLGFAATINFSLVLVPVSRDSKIWSAIGVPFERAILYHAALGHLSFFTLFLHGFLYMVYYVVRYDWEYAYDKAFRYGGSGVNVPAGVLAGACAVPMWIASLQWVRRRYYNRIFATSHFLFIGVFVCGMVHYDGFVYYLLGGFTLYLVHVVSRLERWKRWKMWLCRTPHSPAEAYGSLVHLHTGQEYTRLVLRNPSVEKARGGMFVYVSAPSLLGTIEAHPMSVALRGAPPCLWRTVGSDDTVFTLYIKATGAWTRALHKQDSDALLVDADGFYSSPQSFVSMKTSGYSRVVLFAGGSGFTSFLAFIQDHCVALADGQDSPEVHLVWCCRRTTEMELLGEALPSLLAFAGSDAEQSFKLSLFCSGEDDEGYLKVEWPVATALAEKFGDAGGVCPHAVWHALNSGIRTVIAGGGAFAGWIWGKHLADDHLLEGAATLFFMSLVAVGTLIVYGWMARCLCRWSFISKPFCASAPWKRYLPLRQTRVADDPEDGSMSGSGGACMSSNTTSFEVRHGRTPLHEVLMAEKEHAIRQGFDRVKVLVSGPKGMVDSVMTLTRSIDWKLFDTDASSREF